LEDLYEEDSLIQQLKQQHVKLNETVSKLLWWVLVFSVFVFTSW
jgi:hypothetical protein